MSERRGAGGHSGSVIGVVALLVGAACTPIVAQTVAITGGTVVPVNGAPIPNGTVLIEGDRITAVGANVPVPAGAEVVDARGRFVYPGMIDGRTRLGLTEIGSVAGSNDQSEVGDFKPAMAAAIAINPHSELIPVTRVNGITTVFSAPSGGRVSGVGVIMDLDGWTPEEMARVPLGGLLVNYPQLEPGGGGGFGGFGGGNRLSPEEFGQRARRQVRELEEFFEQAQSYAERKARGALPRLDRQMEAMVPVIDGRIPVIFSADTPDEIMGSIHIGRRFGVRTVILGGRQAWKVADSLAHFDVPVILSAVLSSPGRDDPFDAIYAQPGVLAETGVTFAFSTGDAANARNLPYHAAMATAHGLDPAVALQALTLWPARILGIDQDVGSIETGKVANLFVTDGDPLDVRTNVELVFVRGRPVEMDTRHTRLYQRFRGRPR